MEQSKNIAQEIFDTMADAVKKPIESVSEVASQVGKAVVDVTEETFRIHRNASHTFEDAVSGGIDLAIKGGKAAFDAAKNVKDDPNIVLEVGKAALGKTGQIARDVKDSTVGMYARRGAIYDDTKKIVAENISSVGEGAKYVVKNPKKLSEDAWHHTEAVSKGLVRGSVGSLRDVSGHLQVGREDFEKLFDRIKLQSAEHKELAGNASAAIDPTTDSSAYLDAILVGGDSLHSALVSKIPSDVLDAYKLAMPVMSQTKSFTDYVDGLTTDVQRQLFVSKIKGKLFEIEYVEDLNGGMLPDGYHAELAKRANEPGWDIHITGADGADTEFLQMKATNSVRYVQDALDKYPDIPVVTTSEIHSKLVLLGMEDDIRDGSISLAELQAQAEGGIDAADAGYGGPSVLALALIAFTSYRRKDLSAKEKSHLMGDRAGAYAVAYAAGWAAANFASGGGAYAALIASTVSRTLIGSGRKKFEKLAAMKQLVTNNEALLDKLRTQQRRSSLLLSSS